MKMCDYNYGMRMTVFGLAAFCTVFLLSSCNISRTEDPSQTAAREQMMKVATAAYAARGFETATFGLG
jgi:hypothetical protein